MFAQGLQRTEVESLVNNRNFKIAIPILEKTLSDNKKSIQKETIELRNLLAYSYASIRELDKAQRELDLLSQLKEDLTNKQLVDYYFSQGYVHLEKSRYLEAIQNFEYANEKCELSFEKTSWRYARLALFTGITYRQGFFKNDIALSYFLRGLDVLKAERNTYYEACLNYQIAIVYYERSDFDKLNYYNFKAWKFFDTQPQLYASERAKCYNISAIKTYFTGTLQHALQEYERGLSCLKKYEVDGYLAGRFYDNMGVFCWQKDTTQALSYFRKGLAINRQYLYNEYWISNSLYNIGSYLLYIRQYQYALTYLKEALLMRQKVFSDHHPEIAVLQSHLGDYFEKVNQPDSALYYYESAMENLWTSGNRQMSYLSSVASTSAAQARILKKRYSASKNINDLLMAFKGLLKTDSIIGVAREALDFELSQVSFTSDVRVLYNSLMDISYLLYLASNDEYYAEQAFRIMESVKYSSLLDNLSEAHQYDKSKESLRRDLTGRIMATQVLLSAFEKNSDELKIQTFRRQFVSLMDSMTLLTATSNKFSHQKNWLRLSDLQSQLASNQNQVIEYYENDSAYFAISVTSNRIVFEEIDRNKQFVNNLERFVQICSHKPSLSKGEAVTFSKLSNEVYRNLVAPFLNLTQINELIIVADGQLSYVPFAALVIKYEPEQSHFNLLPYLIRNVSLSNAFSIQILEEQKSKHANSILSSRIAAYTERENPKGLMGAQREINEITKYFKIDIFNSTASFKAKAGLYNLHHFALHGNYDSLDRNKSGIVFSDGQMTDTLFAYELYSMDLPSKLIVLNSCESGSGLYSSGEGVFSLARGFTYAGASAILMNLWKIPDMPVVYLTDRFYQFCEKGWDIDKALTQAKRLYLSEQDEHLTHPYFWSSLTLIGNTGPIKEKASTFEYVAGMLALLLILIIAKYFWRKFNERGQSYL